jgi:predicted nuclease of predicted toxin-antitoxin system
MASANKRGVILISKNRDFVDLVQRFGPPPQLIWVTCGNVTNANLKAIFSAILGRAMDLLAAGEAIVEIG